MKFMLLVTLMLICLFSSSAFGLDPMGAPAATLKQGQSRVGAEYSYSEMDIAANSPVLTLSGTPTPGLIAGAVINDVRSHRIYANLGLGIIDDWEVFLRLGAADLRPNKGSSSASIAGYIGDTTQGFALGGGTKVTFWESQDSKFALGALGQMSWATFSFDQSDAALGYNVAAEIDFVEVQVALGPTFRLAEGFSIYGGPFFHFISGEADYKGTILSVPGSLSVHLSQESMIGGYAGTQIDIGENVSLYVEGQFTGEAYSVAASIALKF